MTVRTAPLPRRERRAVAGGFATQGFVFISLTTRLPSLADRWQLDELEISGLLLAIVLLAGLGSLFAERSIRRARASAVLLRGGLLVTAVAVPLMVTAPAFALFCAGVAAYGVALGVVDASTNMQAVALEHAYRRPILPSFHGAWTAGGLLGAALTLATAGLPLSAAAVVAVAPVAVGVAPFLPRATSVGDPLGGAPIPWRPILLVGLGMVVFYLVDTAAQSWGALYLDQVFITPDRLLALATFPYLLASLVVRLAGDRLVASYGAARVLRTGAVIGCVGLLGVALAPTWQVAVVGFTVVGAGISVVAPLSFSAAARIAGGDDPDRARVDLVIGRFNQFNYLGAVLGAVLTGVIGHDSLRVGFAIPTVLALALLPLARHFSPGPHGTPKEASTSL